jgi:hypothetical protein
MRKERTMKVEQSAVAMNSGHSFSSEYEFSIDSTQTFRKVFADVEQAGETSAGSDSERQAQLLLMIEQLITRLLFLISGKKGALGSDLSADLPAAALPESRANAPAAGIEMAWSNEMTETVREHESSDFSSSGKIRTADGRSLDFKLDLCLSRDFSCERKAVSSGTAVLRDPLVINFDGRSAELDGARFAFDLDGDGKAEAIPGLRGASGYLAIDRNGDGCVNDGSELFGTRSGDGFADLAKLDSDGNHWIDEADSAFDTLRVWQRDELGKDSLCRLRERGVGALHLGAIETPFALKDGDNRRLGQVRASGIYLNEDGSAGSLQQIDLAV